MRASRRRSHHRRRGTRLRLGRQEANLGAEIDIADDHDDRQADNYNDHDGRADDYDNDNDNIDDHNNDNIDDHYDNDQAWASEVDCRSAGQSRVGREIHLCDV